MEKLHTVDGKAKSISHYERKPWLKPLLVGIYRGNRIIPGCLRWCRISSIHSIPIWRLNSVLLPGEVGKPPCCNCDNGAGRSFWKPTTLSEIPRLRAVQNQRTPSRRALAVLWRAPCSYFPGAQCLQEAGSQPFRVSIAGLLRRRRCQNRGMSFEDMPCIVVAPSFWNQSGLRCSLFRGPRTGFKKNPAGTKGQSCA